MSYRFLLFFLHILIQGTIVQMFQVYNGFPRLFLTPDTAATAEGINLWLESVQIIVIRQYKSSSPNGTHWYIKFWIYITSKIASTSKKFLKGQSSNILIPFLTNMDRPRPDKELLLILTFFRGPHDFKTRKIFFTVFRRNPYRKMLIFRQFL